MLPYKGVQAISAPDQLMRVRGKSEAEDKIRSYARRVNTSCWILFVCVCQEWNSKEESIWRRRRTRSGRKLNSDFRKMSEQVKEENVNGTGRGGRGRWEVSRKVSGQVREENVNCKREWKGRRRMCAGKDYTEGRREATQNGSLLWKKEEKEEEGSEATKWRQWMVIVNNCIQEEKQEEKAEVKRLRRRRRRSLTR